MNRGSFHNPPNRADYFTFTFLVTLYVACFSVSVLCALWAQVNKEAAAYISFSILQNI